MEDQRLEALEQAEFYWRKTFYADNPTKVAYAQDLEKYKVFSLSQIAKIVRHHVASLSRQGVTGSNRGGRFEPETLSALIHLRKLKITNKAIPVNLIETALEGGTSWSCASNLTGIPYASYYKQGGAVGDSIRAAPLKPNEKQAIVIAMRANADPNLLAQQYKITVPYAMEIYRAHGNV